MAVLTRRENPKELFDLGHASRIVTTDIRLRVCVCRIENNELGRMMSFMARVQRRSFKWRGIVHLDVRRGNRSDQTNVYLDVRRVTMDIATEECRRANLKKTSWKVVVLAWVDLIFWRARFT